MFILLLCLVVSTYQQAEKVYKYVGSTHAYMDARLQTNEEGDANIDYGCNAEFPSSVGARTNDVTAHLFGLPTINDSPLYLVAKCPNCEGARASLNTVDPFYRRCVPPGDVIPEDVRDWHPGCIHGNRNVFCVKETDAPTQSPTVSPTPGRTVAPTYAIELLPLNTRDNCGISCHNSGVSVFLNSGPHTITHSEGVFRSLLDGDFDWGYSLSVELFDGAEGSRMNFSESITESTQVEAERYFREREIGSFLINSPLPNPDDNTKNGTWACFYQHYEHCQNLEGSESVMYKMTNSRGCLEYADCPTDNACLAGMCTPQGKCNVYDVKCFDNDACTIDACDQTLGCLQHPVNCDDFTVCTLDTCSPQHGCAHEIRNCSDSNTCTRDWCDPRRGCLHELMDPDMECFDFNFCTTEFCDPVNGCGHERVSCDDNNVCTDEYCDPRVGCRVSAVICDDRNPCTSDWCNSMTGCFHDTVICDDENLCTTEYCNESSISEIGCVYQNVECDDRNVCTIDQCFPETGCSHSDVYCGDGDLCTLDLCNPRSGCYHSPVNCTDESVCTIDLCYPEVGCVYKDVICDDEDSCTEDFCDDQAGCMTFNSVCDDQNACTFEYCDESSGCIFEDVNCDDGLICTEDSCDTHLGCINFNAQDECNSVIMKRIATLESAIENNHDDLYQMFNETDQKIEGLEEHLSKLQTEISTLISLVQDLVASAVQTPSSPTHSYDTEECEDTPHDWIDSGGSNCARYGQASWCHTPENPVWAINGIDADQACCVCGGGSTGPDTQQQGTIHSTSPRTQIVPEPSILNLEDCFDQPDDWGDSFGNRCSTYFDNGWCGDELNDLFAVDGVSADVACCVCGGGSVRNILAVPAPAPKPVSGVKI